MAVPKAPMLLASGIILLLMTAVPLAPHRNRFLRQLGILLVPVAGMVVMLLFHSAIRWHVRDWYFAPLGFFGAVTFGVMTAYVLGVVADVSVPGPSDEMKRVFAGWIPAGTFAAILAAAVVFYGPQRSDDFVVQLPHLQNQLEAARWLEANTPPEARIGSFNAGILGYFSDRTVVNLDGVVNEDAYRARRDGLTRQYVCEQEIRYLVDLGLDRWHSVGCNASSSERFELLLKVGRPLGYFRGGQVDVLMLVSEPSAVPSQQP